MLRDVIETLCSARMISAALLEQIPDGLLLVDDDGRIRFANRRAEAIFGYPRGSLVGAHIDSLLPDEARDAHKVHRKAYLQAPESRPMGMFRDLRALRRDGTDVFVQVSLGRVGKRDNFATLAVVRDVGARPNAVEREHILDVAVDAAANGIAITDEAGHFVFVNKAFTQLTGFSSEEVLGKTPRMLKSGRHDEGFYRNLWMTVSRGEVWHGETVNRRKDGSLYVEEQTIAPVHGEGGKITHFVAIKQDVTARRSAEEALRRRVRELGVLHQIALVAIEARGVGELVERFTVLLRDHLDLLGVDLDVHPLADGVPPPSDKGTQPRFRASIPPVSGGGDTLTYPLRVADRDIGELRVRVRPYDLERPEYERFFETIATQIAGAIARVHLQEEMERVVAKLR